MTTNLMTPNPVPLNPRRFKSMLELAKGFEPPTL